MNSEFKLLPVICLLAVVIGCDRPSASTVSQQFDNSPIRSSDVSVKEEAPADNSAPPTSAPAISEPSEPSSHQTAAGNGAAGNGSSPDDSGFSADNENQATEVLAADSNHAAPADSSNNSTSADFTATATVEKSDRPRQGVADKSGKLHEITFDDLNCGMQADIVFRPWMVTDRVKELDGQRIEISGYMHPDAKQKGITEFILLRNTECKFGPQGQADHLIQVKLQPGVTTRYSISPVEVVGRLTLKPFTGPDGNTWSIYEMSGESVSPLRR